MRDEGNRPGGEDDGVARDGAAPAARGGRGGDDCARPGRDRRPDEPDAARLDSGNEPASGLTGPLVNHRDAARRERAPLARVVGEVGRGAPPAAAKVDGDEQVNGEVGERRREELQPGARDPLDSEGAPLAAHDGRHAAHGNRHARRAALEQRHGDVGGGVAEPDDEHAPQRERLEPARLARVQHRAVEPRERAQHRRRARRARVPPGRHNQLARQERGALGAIPARGRDDPPAARRAARSGHARAEAHVEGEARGVAPQVVDKLRRAARPAARRAAPRGLERVVRQPAVVAPRGDVQSVVVRPPVPLHLRPPHGPSRPARIGSAGSPKLRRAFAHRGYRTMNGRKIRFRVWGLGRTR